MSILAFGDSLTEGNEADAVCLTNTNSFSILAFGASQIEGFSGSWTKMNPFTNQLQQRLTEHFEQLHIVIDNQGNCGELAVRMPQRFQRYLNDDGEKKHFDLVIVLGGTNDMGRGFSSVDQPDSAFAVALGDRIADALTALGQQATASGAHCLLLTLFEHGAEKQVELFGKMKETRLRVKERYEALANDNDNVSVFDLGAAFPQLSLSEEEYQRLWADMIHPSKEGYELIGDLLFETVKEIIETRLLLLLQSAGDTSKE